MKGLNLNPVDFKKFGFEKKPKFLTAKKSANGFTTYFATYKGFTGQFHTIANTLKD